MGRKILFITASALLIFATIGVSNRGIQPKRQIQAEDKPRPIGDVFVGEEFYYTVGFWILDDVGVAAINLKKNAEGSGYIATLNAHTTDKVNWLIPREDTYTSHIEMSPDGKRFITKSFEKHVKIGSKIRRSITYLDYDKGLMTWRTWKGDKEIVPKETEPNEMKMMEGVFYDDPMTAFYNFRYGAYGPIGEGREYRITAIPKKEVVDIILRLFTREEMESHFKDRSVVARYLAKVRLDKELFGSKTGDVEILFDERLVPMEVVAKDIFLFGDVTGKIIKPPLPEPKTETACNL
ncbi:MAG: DUF3108 domain-containing protein [Deltaproteobacteria bacterium]|nr:DUF3108 domain-containing protein [Deltaproteobacteria bacterium]